MNQRVVATLSIAGFLFTAQAAAAQEPSPGATSRAEATAFAEGWTALARGDLAVASSVATQVLRDYPRNPSSLALAVDVGIAAQGWRGGLDAYDQWIAGRSVEHFYALRRVARAVLADALVSSPNIRLRMDVAYALRVDGDPDLGSWVALLQEQLRSGGGADARTLAAAGDDDAVASLVASLGQDARPIDSIAAVARSGSKAALAPLVDLLSSPRLEIREAAASALGELGDRGAIPSLKRLLDDQHLLPRMAAVGALLRLGDASGVPQAYDWYRSEVPDIRLRAARVTSHNPDSTWLSFVRELLQDGDPIVRIGAARLLGRFDPGAAKWALEPLANHETLVVREEAQRALPEAIGGDFAELRRYLRAADPDTRVRAALRIVELTR